MSRPPSAVSPPDRPTTDERIAQIKARVEQALTAEDCEAIDQFFNYGMTRGNHHDTVRGLPGPLAPIIDNGQAMAAWDKVRALRSALSSAPPAGTLRDGEWQTVATTPSGERIPVAVRFLSTEPTTASGDGTAEGGRATDDAGPVGSLERDLRVIASRIDADLLGSSEGAPIAWLTPWCVSRLKEIAAVLRSSPSPSQTPSSSTDGPQP